MTNRSRRLTLPVLLVALTAGLIAAPASNAAAAKQKYYVALGDSYAVGYQPGKGSTRNGYVYQVPGLVKSRGYNLKIVNFGCGGATTTSLIKQKGCNKDALGPGAAPYPKQTQIAAATKFIRAHRSEVALITVSIGGNDVTACAREAKAIPCVGRATTGIKENVAAAAKALRAAAGPKPKLIGTTYPDVVLGAWVHPGGAAAESLAKLSVIAFKSLINPSLVTAYGKGKGSLVDVTTATGGYGSMSVFETLAPYGSIPKPVADVCRVSYYCELGDIHLTTAGYRVVAQLVADKFVSKK